MKNLIMLIILGFGGYYAYDYYIKNSYTLHEIEQKPIPKEIFLELWTESALKVCKQSKQRFNMTKEHCKTYILEKSKKCSNKYNKKIPEIVSSQKLSKKYAKKYMRCALPYYFCNGVEVKNEAEAQTHCK